MPKGKVKNERVKGGEPRTTIGRSQVTGTEKDENGQ